VFHINIPEPGDYRIFYTTNPGSFDIVFRVTENSLLTMEPQEGDEIHAISLQKGTITTPPAKTSQIEIFGSDTFEMDPDFGTLVLIQEGEIILPTPTPTPTPQATPTPTPLPVWVPPTPVPPPTYNGNLTVIVAIGDSLTFGSGSGAGGYPAILEWKLQAAGYNVVVRNQGIPGERAYAADARIQSTLGDAQIVLIMTGTNDVIDTIDCPAPAFCDASAHVQSMVDQALAANVVPFVGMIPPIRSDCDTWSNDDIQQLNSQLYAVASARSVPLVDNFYPILNRGGDGLFVDCLHFNDWGYDVIAEQWYNAIVNSNVIRK
jgi:lysophospholipase L1-like esterase